MDKEFIKKYNLSEAVKRFQQINEYTLLGDQKLNEVGEDDMNDPNAQGQQQGMQQGMQQGGQMQPQMGGMQGGQQGMQQDPNSMGGGDPSMMGGDPNAMGGDSNGMGGDPSMMGGDQNAMGGEDPGMMGGDPNGAAPAPGGDPAMGDDPNAANAQNGVEEFNPQGAAPEPLTSSPEENSDEDEEVIDVDELVDSQDEAQAKINNLDGKIDALIKLIGKFETDIDKNNAHIDELKQEIEKRNPTQVEKMTLRSDLGEPFNQTPKDFWAQKEAEGNYSPESDNDGVGDKRYEITKNDVDNITDWNSIYKSIDKGSFHQNLKDILNF
jgi:hypothetical protein